MEADHQSQSTAANRIFVSLTPALAAAPPLAAGLILRLWLLSRFFAVNGDALIYGELANPTEYGADFYDITQGDSHCVTGWKPRTLPIQVRRFRDILFTGFGEGSIIGAEVFSSSRSLTFARAAG